MSEQPYDQRTDLDNFEAVARIIVIGVGGGGNNAVNRMIDENITNVEFYVLNTDKQALATSKAPNRIVIGESVTAGLGAGGDPAVGKAAAQASEKEIRSIVHGANMVFIAAGMGGGTGTGAAPVVGQIAREEGALTVAIVTRPFTFEGKRRIANSVQGLTELREAVDSIIVVSNDNLLINSGKLPVGKAFSESDRILAQSVKTVTDLILLPATINLDFADVKNTLQGSGIALIGFGMGSGPNKAEDAARNAVNSPLLETSISGARKAICAVTCGTEVSLFEAQNCIQHVIEAAGSKIDIYFGVSINDQLDPDTILVSVIAADFEQEYDFGQAPQPIPPLAPSQVGTGVEDFEKKEAAREDASPENREEDNPFGDILPSFLDPDGYGGGDKK